MNDTKKTPIEILEKLKKDENFDELIADVIAERVNPASEPTEEDVKLVHRYVNSKMIDEVKRYRRYE